MPSREAAQLTTVYQAQQAQLRRAAVATAGQAWQAIVDPENVETVNHLPAATASEIPVVAEDAATTSDAYVAAYAAANGAADQAPLGLQAVAVQERAIRVVTGALALAGPAPTSVAAVATFLAAVQAYALRATVGLVTDISRGVVLAGIRQRDDLPGYRRVTGPDPCATCLALSGVVYDDEHPFLGHYWCQCVTEPVTDPDPSEVKRPTGAERFGQMSAAQQDALFEGRGGAEKADLIRSGQITLDDLVQAPNGSKDDHHGLAEKPLSSLQ